MNFREMTPRDRRFVVPTWALSSKYHPNKHARFQLVDRILDSGARVVVYGAEAVHAWAAGDGDRLHFVYVPPELRREGLARRCISELLGSYEERIVVTHPWPGHSDRFVYQPRELLREKAA